MLDEYQKSFRDSWRTVQADSTQPWPYLNEALTKFQVSVFFGIHVFCSFNVGCGIISFNFISEAIFKEYIGVLEELYLKSLF